MFLPRIKWRININGNIYYLTKGLFILFILFEFKKKNRITQWNLAKKKWSWKISADNNLGNIAKWEQERHAKEKVSRGRERLTWQIFSQISSQPAFSWKLSARSKLSPSDHTISVSCCFWYAVSGCILLSSSRDPSASARTSKDMPERVGAKAIPRGVS